MNGLVRCLAPAYLSIVLAAGCSSSGSPTPAAANDAGGAGDAASPIDRDASAGSDAAPLADAASSAANCAFGVSGNRTYPTTDSISCQGPVAQPGGSGDFTFNLAEAFASSSTMENLTFGLLVTSKTAPVAGDTWTVGADGRGGNSSFTVIKGQTGTIWATSDTDAALVKGGTKVTFLSVTKVMGQQKPQDVYYFFEATFEAALNGQSAGTAPLKVSGRAKATTLPFGA